MYQAFCKFEYYFRKHSVAIAVVLGKKKEQFVSQQNFFTL